MFHRSILVLYLSRWLFDKTGLLLAVLCVLCIDDVEHPMYDICVIRKRENGVGLWQAHCDHPFCGQAFWFYNLVDSSLVGIHMYGAWG